ncbi:hypothetical protein KR026_012269 [Drosophila bipectinata]|nr:hypothetical protein KR026_012269 [Drosophila bipectinata]
MKFASQLGHSVFNLYLKHRRFHIPPAESVMEKTHLNVELQDKLIRTRGLIKRALDLYSPSEWIVSFNGGKDCTVLLDIVSKIKPPAVTLRAVYVRSLDPFEEMENFIEASSQRYGIQLRRYNGILKLAIEQLVAEEPQLKAVFLGCRHSDPGCSNLPEMIPCDNGWPPLMRIFPLLEWSYHDIWSYLRANSLPYCSLYDQGYTSLGDRHSTHLNPSLLVYDKKLDKLTYRAAYELEDSHLERANRIEAGQVTAEKSEKK